MRKLIFIAFIALVAMSFTKDDNISWTNWNEGYTRAMSEKKPVLVFIFSPLCNQCKRMLEKTFVNKELIGKVNKDFIAIQFDIDKAVKIVDGVGQLDIKPYSGSKTLQKVIGGPQLGIPKTVIWNPATDKILSAAGVQSVEDVKDLCNEILQ